MDDHDPFDYARMCLWWHFRWATSPRNRRSGLYGEMLADALVAFTQADASWNPKGGAPYRSWMIHAMRRAVIDGMRLRLGRNGQRILTDVDTDAYPVEWESEGPGGDEPGIAEVDEAAMLAAVVARVRREVGANYAVLVEMVGNGAKQVDVARRLGLTEGRVSQMCRRLAGVSWLRSALTGQDTGPVAA